MHNRNQQGKLKTNQLSSSGKTGSENLSNEFFGLTISLVFESAWYLRTEPNTGTNMILLMITHRKWGRQNRDNNRYTLGHFLETVKQNKLLPGS